jgi:hypothetical protein
VIDAERRLAETTLGAEGVLDGEDVLPGFSCTLASILA